MSRQPKRGSRPQSSVFLQLWSLYQTCRETGTWAKLVLENGDDGETFLFSSKPTTVPAPDVPVADNRHHQAQSHPVQVKRKTPSRSRKDRARWRAWLERKLEETKQSNTEETAPVVNVNVQVAEQPPPPSSPSYAAAVSSGGVGGAGRPAAADPTHQAMQPINQPSTPVSRKTTSWRDHSLVDTLHNNQSPVRSDGNFIVTSPGGTELAVLQPVVPGIPQLDGEVGKNSEDDTSDDETSDDETSNDETSDDEGPEASSHSPLAAPPREAAAPLQAAVSPLQEAAAPPQETAAVAPPQEAAGDPPREAAEAPRLESERKSRRAPISYKRRCPITKITYYQEYFDPTPDARYRINPPRYS